MNITQQFTSYNQRMNLFDLSKYHLVPILSEWLSLSDNVILDSAVAETSRRATLINFMSEYHNVFEQHLFPTGCLLPITDQLTKWCTLRKWNQTTVLEAVTATYTYQTVHLVSQCAFHLKSVHLTNCSVNDIYDVVIACTRLETLVTDGIVKGPPLENHRHLPARSYPLLTLCLRDFMNWEQLIIDILVTCPLLTSLTTNDLSGQCLACSLIVRGLKLQKLVLCGGHCDDIRPMEMFCMHGVARYHSLKCCWFDEELISLFLQFRSGPHLLDLDLSVKCNVSTRSILDLPDPFPLCCPNLTSLSLRGNFYVSDDSVIPILRQSTQLTYLNLVNILDITVELLHDVCDHCPALKRIKFSKGYTPISEDVVRLSIGCPLLEDLTLSYLQFEDHDLLPAVPLWTNLTSLDISGSPKLTDEMFVKIFATCTKLAILAVHNAKNVSVKSLNAMIQHCPDMHTLSIGLCTALVKKTRIAMMLKECHSLTSLDLYASKLNADILSTILLFGGKLKQLGLVECKGVPDDLLYALAAMPRLRVLGITREEHDYSKMRELNSKLVFDWSTQHL